MGVIKYLYFLEFNFFIVRVVNVSRNVEIDLFLGFLLLSKNLAFCTAENGTSRGLYRGFRPKSSSGPRSLMFPNVRVESIVKTIHLSTMFLE